CLTACAGELGGTTAADPVAAPQEGWMLLVRSDGPRWLGPAWWRAQGVDPDSLDVAGIQIAGGGDLVPYLVLDSPQGPGVLFYAEATSSDLTSAMTTGHAGGYSLKLGTSEKPAEVIGMESEAPRYCQIVTEAKTSVGDDAFFRSTAPLDSPWLWHALRPVEGITVTVVLTDVVPATPVTLTTTAWGQSSMPEDPDHHLRMLWNGTTVGDHLWDGSAVETWTVAAAVGETQNTLGLIAPGGTEAAVELTWLDAVEVAWQQALVASENRWQAWAATGAGGACFATSGAGAGDGFVAVLRDGAGAVRYSMPIYDTPAGVLQVSQRAGDRGWLGQPWSTPPPDLARPRETLPKSELEQVEYLAIAPRQFHEALAPLIEARSLGGQTAMVVTPESVYDTFGSGVPSALSIQVLVNDLAERGSLASLLLVGDTSSRPASAWDPETVDLPTIWAKTAHVGATASDYAIATGGGEAPLVAVGRFPVSTVDELVTMVEKTLAWEASDRLLLISDDEPAFLHLTERLGEIAAPDLVVDAALDGAREEVLRWLGEGPGTLVYTGHGSMNLLGDEKLLLLEDGANWSQPTVIAAWSCLCASFAHPTYASLAEAWLLAPKGVVAVVGPTGETTTAEQTTMALALQRSLSSGEVLGQALLSAWRASQSENTRHGFVLLGDPSLQPMPAIQGGIGADD
ncbi:MAG: hypothetical protein JXC32_21330, partial [Anaerolineae bacterium]|nr:hypothetical protein [Anaerolineae bacterium]